MGTTGRIRWAVLVAGMAAAWVGVMAMLNSGASAAPPTTVPITPTDPCPEVTMAATPSHATPGSTTEINGSGFPLGPEPLTTEIRLGGTPVMVMSLVWDVVGDSENLYALIEVPVIPAGQHSLVVHAAVVSGGSPVPCGSIPFTVDQLPPTSTTTATTTTAPSTTVPPSSTSTVTAAGSTTLLPTTTTTTSTAPPTTSNTSSTTTTTLAEPITSAVVQPTSTTTTLLALVDANHDDSTGWLPLLWAFLGGVAAVLLVGSGWWLARRRYAGTDGGEPPVG